MWLINNIFIKYSINKFNSTLLNSAWQNSMINCVTEWIKAEPIIYILNINPLKDFYSIINILIIK